MHDPAVPHGLVVFSALGMGPGYRRDKVVTDRLIVERARGFRRACEREAVVVIHPLVGYRDTPTFALDTGRLCVALSRHRAHATVLVDTSSDAVLQRAQADTTLARHRQVLSELLATS
jgi:hypothetical protein